jgi:hypothetical protein
MQKDYSSTGSSRLDRAANQTDPSPWTVAQNMNQRAKPPRPAGARWAGLRLAMSLLPGVAISASSSVAPEFTPSPGSRPYLASVGAPALRFGEAPPPPDLRPAAGAPPQPKEESPANVPDVIAASSSAQPIAENTPPVSAPPESKPAPVRTAPPILPDDTRSKVRAEDFLPFFQFPASGSNAADVTVVTPVAPTAPTAAPLPASSATYRQQ